MKKRILVLMFLASTLFGQSRPFSPSSISASKVTDREALIALYNSTDGDNWTNNTNWNSDAPLRDWFGVMATDGVITELVLLGNQLAGSIAPEIGNLTTLTGLHLSGNQLTGSIPPEIGNLTSLVSLSISHNQLTGSIPPELSNLNSLTNINLSRNQLTGSIPSELENLDSLDHLLLYKNQLTGSIPPELGNLNSLTGMDFSRNQLTGSIPPELGNLASLIGMFLYANQLTGSVPPEIGNLDSLTSLWLFDNQLTELPNLTALTSLEDLRIENNKFTFEDIEPNVNVPSNTFLYAPQEDIGVEQDTVGVQDSSFTFSVSTGGTSNEYQWKKDGSNIDGADRSSYTIAALKGDDYGSYTCSIRNSIVSFLSLYTAPINLNILIPDDVELLDEIPTQYSLEQNYPNPFNPSTLINFSLPKEDLVSIKVYDSLGKLITTLVNENKRAGNYSVSFNGERLSSGIYFYKITTSQFAETKKMVLVR